MSYLNNAFTFLPFFYFSRLSPDAPVLVVTDHSQRLRIDFSPLPCPVFFALPKSSCPEDSAIRAEQLLEWDDALLNSGRQFGAIIVDLEQENSEAAVSKLRPLLLPGGRLIRLDWRASRSHALRNLGRHFRRPAQPENAPRNSETDLRANGLQPVWHFLPAPDLQKPRFLVQPGIQQSLPVETASPVKKWLLQNGAFYLQARQKVTVTQAADAAEKVVSPVEIGIAEITGLQRLSQIRQTIRKIYISTTNVLMIQFQHRRKDYFLRFPFTKRSMQRVQNQAALCGFLAENNVAFTPKPLKISGLPLPVYGESGQPGRDVEKHFANAPLSEARAIFDAALQKMAEIHNRFGEIRTFDPAVFEQHIQPRLTTVLQRCPAAKNAVEAVGAFFRQRFEGKRVLLSVCHGDFKIGNCLFDKNNAIASIIDWDMGEKNGLTLVDATSLFAKSLRIRHGYSLADLLRRAQQLPDDFLSGFQRYFADAGASAVSPETAIVFYWLDRVYKQIAFDAHLKESWIQKNVIDVIPVLGKRWRL